MTNCDFSIDAARPDGYFPSYQSGNVAILRIRTYPQQIKREACRKRWFKKFGERRWTYQGKTSLGYTDENGVLVRYAYIPNAPDLFGHYYDEYSICDCPNKDNLTYTIGSQELTKPESAELSEEVKEPLEKVGSLV